MAVFLPTGIATADALLRKASIEHRLSAFDLTALLQALWSGHMLVPERLKQVQSVLKIVKASDPAGRKVIESFLALDHRGYVARRMQILVQSPTVSVPVVAYRQDHIPKDTPHNRRPGLALASVTLTIHSTGNPVSSARNERGWLTNASNDRTASFHVVVDENEAVECIPLAEVAWHAGDGNGNGNRGSIGLEICESGDRAKTLQNAASVTARVLKLQGLTVADLRRHYDWSKKNCPRILIDAAFRGDKLQTWDWFKTEVGRALVSA